MIVEPFAGAAVADNLTAVEPIAQLVERARWTPLARSSSSVLTGRDLNRLEQQAATMTDPPLVVAGDLRHASFGAVLTGEVHDPHGRLDVLVNGRGPGRRTDDRHARRDRATG